MNSATDDIVYRIKKQSLGDCFFYAISAGGCIPEGWHALTGVRVDGAAGPLALGPKGSIRDRLTPPGWVQGLRPRELYNTAALARYGACGAIL